MAIPLLLGGLALKVLGTAARSRTDQNLLNSVPWREAN